MKISKKQSVREDWDQVKSWNYKLKHLKDYQSVVYAELDGDHGEVETKEVERVYFVLEGEGSFDIDGEIIEVEKGDVITVSPHTKYNYRPTRNKTLKILLFMELWAN
jgi:mannose-6-phosphate isomerase-like protein (cupin superfamily)